jgi:hypothetical protein
MDWIGLDILSSSIYRHSSEDGPNIKRTTSEVCCLGHYRAGDDQRMRRRGRQRTGRGLADDYGTFRSKHKHHKSGTQPNVQLYVWADANAWGPHGFPSDDRIQLGNRAHNQWI